MWVYFGPGTEGPTPPITQINPAALVAPGAGLTVLLLLLLPVVEAAGARSGI